MLPPVLCEVKKIIDRVSEILFAAEIAFCGGWPTFTFFVKVGTHASPGRNFDLGLAPLIDSHRPRFPKSITPIAAPRPLLRFLHEPSHHRIAVRIAQLLDPLARRPDVEIIEASLPHVFGPDCE